jgi:hypothetical protein
VRGVEGNEFVEESECRVGGFVGMNGGEAEPGVVIDCDVQVLPTGLALGLAPTVAGDAVSRPDDSTQPLMSTCTSSPGAQRS